MKNDEVVKKILKLQGVHIAKLAKEALARGAKVEIVSEEDKIYQFSYKGKCVYVVNTSLPFNTTGVRVVPNKQLTKEILAKKGIKLAKGITVKNYAELEKRLAKKELSFPLVVKPIDAAKGAGVTTMIKDKIALKRAIQNVEKYWATDGKRSRREILVEEHFEGNDYRFLVLNGRVIAIAERRPAGIAGDGKRTIEQLIDDFNAGKTYGLRRTDLNKLNIDEEVKRKIKDAGYDLSSVLPRGKKLRLRGKANISAGGLCIDMLGKADKKFIDLAVKAAEACGLKYAGVDFLAKDITDPKSDYILVEVNGAPQYYIHEECDLGKSRDITKIVVKEMFK